MLFGHQDRIQAPRIIDDRLQAAHALVFCLVELRIAPIVPKEVDNLIDSCFAKLRDPTYRITGQCHAETLDALIDLVGTVFFVSQIIDVVPRLFKPGTDDRLSGSWEDDKDKEFR